MSFIDDFLARWRVYREPGYVYGDEFDGARRDYDEFERPGRRW